MDNDKKHVLQRSRFHVQTNAHVTLPSTER